MRSPLYAYLKVIVFRPIIIKPQNRVVNKQTTVESPVIGGMAA